MIDMKSLQSFFSKHHSYAVVKQKLSFLFLLCTLILSPTIGAVEKVHATSFYHSLPSSWRTASTQAQTSVPIIDYFVVYDPSGKAVAIQRGGMAKYAQEVVESINAVLRNSHVEGRFRLAGYMEIAEKAQSINQGLGLVSAHAEVRRQRDAAKADLVVLLSEPVNDGASGLATQEAKSIDAGFSSVRASMAAVNYTAAHEAAHNIGCQHSRQQVDAGKHEYAVGASRPEYRTVMAGPHDHVGGQVPIFSGPKSVWKGVVLGSATEDNVRMLRERMPIVAQFSEGNTQISFAPAEWRPDHRAQTLEVKMTTTAAYLVTSDAAWLTTDLKSGYNSKTFRLSVADNPQKESRVGHLRFELIGDDESTFVNYTVVQQGTDPSSDQPEPKPDPKPVEPDPKPVEPVKPDPKPVKPAKPDPKPVEPVNPPKVEEIWSISPNDIHVSAKDTIVVLTIDAPAEFSLQTSAMWFSSTLWQGQGQTKIKLMVEPNEEDKPRNAVLDCHFYLPQSDRKVVEHVKILQEAPIKSGVAGVSTATSFNYSCGWEGDILHVAAPEGAKVEVISLEGRELQQTVINQTSCSFRIPRGQSSLLVRVTAKGRAVVQKVSRAD